MKLVFIKSKELPIGTIREWKGGRYQKGVNRWIPVKGRTMDGRSKEKKSEIKKYNNEVEKEAQAIATESGMHPNDIELRSPIRGKTDEQFQQDVISAWEKKISKKQKPLKINSISSYNQKTFTKN